MVDTIHLQSDWAVHGHGGIPRTKMRANRANEPLLWAVDVIHQEIITAGLPISDQALATARRQLMHFHPELHRVARSDFLETWKGDPIVPGSANSRVRR